MPDSHVANKEIVRLTRELDEAREGLRQMQHERDSYYDQQLDAETAERGAQEHVRFLKAKFGKAETAQVAMVGALEAFVPLTTRSLCGGCGGRYRTCLHCHRIVAETRGPSLGTPPQCSGHRVEDHASECPVSLRQKALANLDPAVEREMKIVKAAEVETEAEDEYDAARKNFQVYFRDTGRADRKRYERADAALTPARVARRKAVREKEKTGG